MIKDYQIEEKTLLSAKGKQEFSNLIKENERLTKEVELWKETYKRLKK